MPDLITVPSFVFQQGDPFDQDPLSEQFIHVQYYDGTIVLEQEGNEVKISPDYFEALFKEIRKHKPEAEKALKR